MVLAAVVAAQDPSEGTGSSTAASTASATSGTNPTIHTVTVGEGGYNKFEPNATVAQIGDIIQFLFYPQNHSVVKAEAGYPCIPYDTMNPGRPSFFSGFEYVPQPPSFNLTVNDTKETFFYCSAPGSCTTYGMVGVINPRNKSSIDTQAAKALEAGSIMLQPGQSFPSEDTSSSLANIATATLTSTVTVPSATNGSLAVTATASATSTPSHHGLSGGAIAGIAIGGVAALVLLGALIWYMSRSRALKQTLDHQQQRQPHMVESQQQPPPTGPFDEGRFDGSRWSTARSSLPPYSGGPLASPKMMKTEEMRDVRAGSPAPEGYFAHELPSKEGEEAVRTPRLGYLSGPVASELDGGTVHEMD
ncbi:hypothetical protein MBLNU459_g3491t1 [Dothideomycetes sp. NU459]